MKLLIWFLAIFALASSAMALKNEICGLAHSADGNASGVRCAALFRNWTYKKDSNECDLFTYGGCGGNDNRFETKEECEEMCKE